MAILVGLALLGLLVYFATHASRPLIWLATGLLLGGALGNLLDRIRTGSVIDFIQLPLGWPPFNLADASIVLGVALLLFAIESPRSAPHERVHPGGNGPVRSTFLTPTTAVSGLDRNRCNDRLTSYPPIS